MCWTIVCAIDTDNLENHNIVFLWAVNYSNELNNLARSWISLCLYQLLKCRPPATHAHAHQCA